jgi:hypothetical protein
MAIIKRVSLRDVWGEEYPPDIDYNGIRPYRPTDGSQNRYVIFNEMVLEIKSVVVHKFTMGDVDDPDLYAAEPLYQWQQTEQGKWVMDNAHETPIWNRYADPMTYGYSYTVSATFDTKKLTEYYLRFGNDPVKK